MKEGVEFTLNGEVEILPCLTDGLGLIPIDPDFPQQAYLRSSHKISCQVDASFASEASYEIVVKIPSGAVLDLVMKYLSEILLEFNLPVAQAKTR